MVEAKQQKEFFPVRGAYKDKIKSKYEEMKRQSELDAKEIIMKASWDLKDEEIKEFKRHTKFLLIFVVTPLATAVAAFFTYVGLAFL